MLGSLHNSVYYYFHRTSNFIVDLFFPLFFLLKCLRMPFGPQSFCRVERYAFTSPLNRVRFARILSIQRIPIPYTYSHRLRKQHKVNSMKKEQKLKVEVSKNHKFSRNTHTHTNTESEKRRQRFLFWFSIFFSVFSILWLCVRETNRFTGIYSVAPSRISTINGSACVQSNMGCDSLTSVTA